MLFRRKPHWRGLLERCDHDVAAAALMHYVTQRHPSEPLARALEHYFQNPTYYTALPVIAADPETILLFRESRPGGAYYRLTHANPTA
jgi:hypothetical protein